MNGDFKTHIGGILAGIAKAIDTAVGAKTAEGGYVKTIAIRTGLLRREGLREAVRSMLGVVNPLPIVIVCYVLGNDERIDDGATLAGEPLTYRHEAAFSVIVVDADTRGQTAQLEGSAVAPGIVRMIDDVREILSGVQFEGETAEGGKFDLNEWPLEPAGVEPIDQVPNVSAFAQHFLTNFQFTTPDRRVAPVTIEEIRFGLDVLGAAAPRGETPGVHTQVTV